MICEECAEIIERGGEFYDDWCTSSKDEDDYRVFFHISCWQKRKIREVGFLS